RTRADRLRGRWTQPVLRGTRGAPESQTARQGKGRHCRSPSRATPNQVRLPASGKRPPERIVKDAPGAFCFFHQAWTSVRQPSSGGGACSKKSKYFWYRVRCSSSHASNPDGTRPSELLCSFAARIARTLAYSFCG